MVFSTDLFLFLFLPAFLAVYYLTPPSWRNLTAALGSLVFYAFGAESFVFVLLGSCVFDHWSAKEIAAATTPRRKKIWLVTNLVTSLALLAWFKYANFGVAELNTVLVAFGFHELGWSNIALPIGISFFTFHKVSYLVDVYVGRVVPARSFVDYVLYIVLFPQLIAGPIVRYHDIDAQIRSREYDPARLWRGVERFVIGLAKKTVIANPLSQIVDDVHKLPIEFVPVDIAWLAALCYFFQIYFDFSGYSDMAVGLGRMLGLEFPENFARPYAARTFTEFWRRWHISLSNFMRVYLYIPLGGNRGSAFRTYLNLWIVFLVSGLWHGASWNFVAWGAYQGVFLTADRLFLERLTSRLPGFVMRLTTCLLVLFSWVLFRATTIDHATGLWGRMLGLTASSRTEVTLGIDRFVPLTDRTLTMLLVAGVICILPWSAHWLAFEQRLLRQRERPLGAIAGAVLVYALFILAVMALVSSSHNPFIYFRF